MDRTFKITGKLINIRLFFFNTFFFSIFRLHLTPGIGSLSILLALHLFTWVSKEM